MSDRTYHLRPGDKLWAPENLDWEDDKVFWVLFKVIENVRSEDSCSLTLEREGGKRSVHVLNSEIGICIIE